MTTRVTVDAHAGWPVFVMLKYGEHLGVIVKGVIDPGPWHQQEAPVSRTAEKITGGYLPGHRGCGSCLIC